MLASNFSIFFLEAASSEATASLPGREGSVRSLPGDEVAFFSQELMLVMLTQSSSPGLHPALYLPRTFLLIKRSPCDLSTWSNWEDSSLCVPSRLCPSCLSLSKTLIPIHKATSAPGSISSAAVLPWTLKKCLPPPPLISWEQADQLFCLQIWLQQNWMVLGEPWKSWLSSNCYRNRESLFFFFFTHEFWVMPQHGSTLPLCHGVALLHQGFFS